MQALVKHLTPPSSTIDGHFAAENFSILCCENIAVSRMDGAWTEEIERALHLTESFTQVLIVEFVVLLATQLSYHKQI